MPFPIRRVQTQQEKVIDYQYIRNLKNREVRKNRFKQTLSQRLFRLLLFIVLLGEVGYLGYVGVQMLKTSPLFLLNHVEITGTVHTKPEEIRALVLSNHNNTLTADLTEIKLRLETHPWVQSAVIWRALPATIHVHITERKPAALVLSGKLYLVDRLGRVIQVFEQDPQYASLPVLTGVTDISHQAEIQSLLTYVDALEGDPTLFKQVSEIHYHDNASTVLYLKGMPFGLVVSRDGILPMIRKFLRYAEFMNQNFSDQEMIDLRYEDQIVLKNAYKEQL